MGRLLKIQTPSFLLLLFCPKSPELLVAALQEFQGFSMFLQCYRGVVPAGRDSLGCKEAPSRHHSCQCPRWLDLTNVGFFTLLKWPNPIGHKGEAGE